MPQPIDTFLAQVTSRGMLQDHTQDLLHTTKRDEIKAMYVGFDPTAPALHVGHLMGLQLLLHAARAGIKPVALIGGATAMIGDPAGKITERPLLDADEIKMHAEALYTQLNQQLAAFFGEKPCILNNADWLKEQSLLSFLREVGKHFPIGNLMGKESNRRRLEQGLSFTEFSYSLLQAYDFCHLYEKYEVRLQCGGSDQWGNIVSGVEYIRRRLGATAHGATTPLILRADGSKFGKSDGQNIWLSPTRTSPYAFYQFWYNQDDQECAKWLLYFTMYPKNVVADWLTEHKKAPNKRLLQSKLATSVTESIHGRAVCKQVVAASNLLFGGSTLEAPEDAFALLSKEIPYQRVPRTALSDVNVLFCDVSKGKVCGSRSELRRLLAGRGISVNNTLLTDTGRVEMPLAHERYLLVRRGKKHFVLLEAVE